MPLALATAQALVAGPGMTAAQTIALIELLLTGTLPAEAGGGLLRTWAGRGETEEELAAVVGLLLERAVAVPTRQPGLEVVGTGGSGLTRYNVSTTTAFILAAAGIPVAKHGNRGSQRPDGSFDLLEALGLPLSLPPDKLVRLQDETGLCFLFARAHHPAVAAAVPYRKVAGCRTVFNLAGPLANPARISHQVVGVAKVELAARVAGLLRRLGRQALVVWGHPGLDEWSVTGPSRLWQVDGQDLRELTVPPPLHPQVDPHDLPGGEATQNAAHFHRLMTGQETGPLRDLVLLNAGAAIDLWRGRPITGLGEGYREAALLLTSGTAHALFERYRTLARTLAT